MTSVGFYIPQIDKSELNVEIFEALNKLIEENKVTDACVFYDDVDFNPVAPMFGMFNGTDIWHYQGILISTTLGVCNSARNAVNKFRLYHLFSADEKALMQLLSLSFDVNFITRSDEETAELYRLTGLDPVLQISSIQDLTERLGELE